MMYNLFLDDERDPWDVTWIMLPNVNWTVVRKYDSFVECVLKNGVPSIVSFDHDLADFHYGVMLKENTYTHDDGDLTKTFDYGPEKTGFDCAKWLVEYCRENDIKFPYYTVHSMNPVGSKRIKDYIENAKQHLDI